MLARAGARLASQSAHYAVAYRSAGRSVGPATFSPRSNASLERRAFSLWPGSKPKAAESPTESAALPQPAHDGTVTATPSVVETAPIIETADAIPAAQAATDNWTLASQILAEHECGSGFWVGTLQTALQYLQLETGWPWWCAIMTFAVFTRLSFWPMMGRSIANQRRMSVLAPQMQPLLAKQVAAKRSGDKMKQLQAVKETQALWKAHNVHPARALIVPLVSIPVGIGSFFGLRGMANGNVPGFADGGALWFPDLTAADPYHILPVTSALTQIISLRLGIETGVDPATQTPQQAQVKTFLQVAMLVTIPFTWFMPAAMLVYWNSSNFTALVTSQLFRLDAVKRMFGITDVVQVATPVKPASFYQTVLQSMPPPPSETVQQATTPPPTGSAPAQDPTQLRESLLGGDVRLDAGRPLAKRHRGRIEDFGNEFADHLRKTGGNPWPLPAGLSNAAQATPTDAPRQEAARIAASQTVQGATAAGAGAVHPPQVPPNSAPKSRGFSTLAFQQRRYASGWVQKYRSPSDTPVFYNSQAAIEAAVRAAREGKQRLEQSDGVILALESAQEKAAALRQRRIELFKAGRAQLSQVAPTTRINEVEAVIRAFLQQQDTPQALIDDLTTRLRRRYLTRIGLDNATTTLEYSSAQSAGRAIGALNATDDEIRRVVDLAATFAANQKKQAFQRGYLRRRISAGKVDWAPRPLYQSPYEYRFRAKANRLFMRRFKQERLGRWKRILGWRVGHWDRSAANQLSHDRRWARGTLEEWQGRKREKRQAEKTRANGWRRFQAYRKEL